MNTKPQIIVAIEEIATINQFLARISSSLVAVQHALEEVSPNRFAEAYERNLKGPIPVKVAQELNSKADSLFALARSLKQS